jgi:hypothetical protein
VTDRELDALVAEKVMGLPLLWAHKVWSMEDWLTTDYPTEQNTMAIVNEDKGDRISMPKFLVIPHYSTDIGAAWLVVERVTRIPESDEEATRAANTRFALWFERTSLWAMTAKEAAHAICMGALEAVGVSL